jgi:myosin heavy subunit
MPHQETLHNMRHCGVDRRTKAEGSVTAIYHLNVQIIGRDSGRSAVGSAAYRAAEKLKAVGAAAYRSGQDLEGEGDEGNEITHDYTRKKGVVYKEIILPDNAPPEFADRQTLWNAVEKSERRRDARLAREIEVGLQREFDLQENIELLREYVKENFVDKGMVADFAVHDKKDGNPHAHIMLTTRHVSPDGFGGKNRAWDKDYELVSWRKNWAEVNNRKFEEKGLDERIDHRSYKDRGIDREPTIHLGHEAWALEKKGIRTAKGDYNREVQKRNLERAAENVPSEEQNQKPESAQLYAVQNETPQLKIETTTQQTEESQKIAQFEKELQKIHETQKTTQYIEKPIKPENASPYVSPIEKQLNTEKATQHIEKMQTQQQHDTTKTAKRMNALKEKYLELETAKNSLIDQHNKDKLEIPPLEYRTELMDEHAKNIEVLQDRVEQLLEARRNIRWLEFKKKYDIDEKIMLAAHELGRAQDYFKNRFHIDPSQAAEELKRLQEDICIKKDKLDVKQVRVQIIRDKQAALELEYHTQKLLNKTRPDHEQTQINVLLEQMRQPPQSVRDKMLHERIERQLNVISDAGFQKVMDNLPAYEAHVLTNIREQAKEQEQLLKFEREQAFLTRYYQTQDKKERERLLRAEDERRNRTYERSR